MTCHSVALPCMSYSCPGAAQTPADGHSQATETMEKRVIPKSCLVGNVLHVRSNIDCLHGERCHGTSFTLTNSRGITGGQS